MERSLCAICLLVLTYFAPPALAQGYPVRAVRVIVPTAPGGPSDLNGRGIAQVLSEGLGQPFVV